MEEKTVSDVLQNLCLDLAKDQDGRTLSEYHIGGLVAVAETAERLDLPDAEKFRTLANVARKRHAKDLRRAALSIFMTE